MRARLLQGLSSTGAAGTVLAVLAPKCPLCLAAYATPVGAAVAAGVVGSVAFTFVRRRLIERAS
jgi:hypothetical protein